MLHYVIRFMWFYDVILIIIFDFRLCHIMLH